MRGGHEERGERDACDAVAPARRAEQRVCREARQRAAERLRDGEERDGGSGERGRDGERRARVDGEGVREGARKERLAHLPEVDDDERAAADDAARAREQRPALPLQDPSAQSNIQYYGTCSSNRGTASRNIEKCEQDSHTT